MHHIYLGNEKLVSKIFDYLETKLDAEYRLDNIPDPTSDEDFLQDRVMLLLQKSNTRTNSKYHMLEIAYVVNPDRGGFANVLPLKTDVVEITIVKGKLLDESRVEEIKRELAGLT